MSAPSYVFGGNTGETQESLKRRRAIVDAMVRQVQGAAPRNVGEGIDALGGAIGALISRNSLRRDEAALQEKQGALWNDIGSAIDAGGDSALAYDPAGPSTASDGADPSGASPAAVDLSGDRKTFVDTLMPAAMEASQRTGVDPRIIVAQAAQETGWGRSAPGNNYFGIKSHGQGGGQNLATEEVVNGQRVKVRDSFRTFASPGDSVAGYADFLLESPRYGKMRAAQGLDAQLEALGASGYATDPNYSGSVGAIARSLNLPTGPPANAGAPATQAPAQVASADPSFMPEAPPVPSTGEALAGALAAQGADANGRAMLAAPETVLAYRGPESAPPSSRPAASNAAALPPLPAPSTVEPNPTPPPVAAFFQDVQRAAAADRMFDGFSQSPRGQLARVMMANGSGLGLPDIPAAPTGEPLPFVPSADAPVTERLAQSMQVGAARRGEDPTALLRVLQSPYASDEQRQLAGQLLNRVYARQDAAEKRAYERNDPDAVLNRRFKQAQTDALSAKQPNETDDIREYRFAQQGGYTGSFADYMSSMKKAGAASTTVNTGENTSEFVKKSDEAAAKRLGDIVDAGNSAPAFMGDIQQLAELGKSIGTGKGAQITAALGPYADMFGIKLDGLDEGQAFNAIVSRIAPQMRPAGAGATSDFDARQYLSSLPSLANTPGGNEVIADTFRSISENKIAAADIAQRAQSGEIRWQDAEREIRALPNPYQRYREFRKNGASGASSSPSSTATGSMRAVPGQRYRPDGVPVGGDGGLPPAMITDRASYDALPSGATFIAPDGTTRRKP